DMKSMCRGDEASGWRCNGHDQSLGAHLPLSAGAKTSAPDESRASALVRAGTVFTQSPKRGRCIYDLPECGGSATQCTVSLFAAATAFFGSVSSSTPSLYLAWAVASSTS